MRFSTSLRRVIASKTDPLRSGVPRPGNGGISESNELISSAAEKVNLVFLSCACERIGF